MSESGGNTVECAVCGEPFDPEAAGGFCTNPDCGKWQYTPEKGAESDEPVEGSEAEPAPEPGGNDEPEEPAAEPGPDEQVCPSCGSVMGTDVQYCTSCGTDLTEGEEEPAEEEPPEVEALTECPSCGASVDEGDAFCSSCGEDLDEHRQAAAEPTPDAQPEVEAEPDAAAGGFTLEFDGTPVKDDTGSAKVYRDGDIAGSDIRSSLLDAGYSREDAQYIHREHIEFIEESDGFYVSNPDNRDRKNAVIVNGTELPMGERQQIADGDTIELSGVATGKVRIVE